MEPNGKLTEFPQFPELTFDEERHIYRLDGDAIPSVSRLMEPLKNANYAGISDRTLERAARKGTSVHNSIENWLKFDIEDVNPEHSGYFHAFKSWWLLNKPELIDSECRVYRQGVCCDRK